jgi:hypothetical protein
MMLVQNFLGVCSVSSPCNHLSTIAANLSTAMPQRWLWSTLLRDEGERTLLTRHLLVAKKFVLSDL